MRHPFYPSSLHAQLLLTSPDLCGTVSQAVAPYSTAGPANTANMQLPLPHSHGTAVQYIDDPSQDSMYTCPDVDTCDQETNPACLPGSANYPVGGNTVGGSTQNPFSSSNPVQISRNLYRESRCAADPTIYYCFVEGVPCESSVEVLTYYDGAAPVCEAELMRAQRTRARAPFLITRDILLLTTAAAACAGNDSLRRGHTSRRECRLVAKRNQLECVRALSISG